MAVTDIPDAVVGFFSRLFAAIKARRMAQAQADLQRGADILAQAQREDAEMRAIVERTEAEARVAAELDAALSSKPAVALVPSQPPAEAPPAEAPPPAPAAPAPPATSSPLPAAPLEAPAVLAAPVASPAAPEAAPVASPASGAPVLRLVN